MSQILRINRYSIIITFNDISYIFKRVRLQSVSYSRFQCSEKGKQKFNKYRETEMKSNIMNKNSLFKIE